MWLTTGLAGIDNRMRISAVTEHTFLLTLSFGRSASRRHVEVDRKTIAPYLVQRWQARRPRPEEPAGG